ncbi:MAG: serine hydrolase [Burkholderiales bacterium]|nr:serine hydrolase [Burkholderiales bacterium]MDE2277234.1 serine hydrolase [Burkholderiales bacterium]
MPPRPDLAPSLLAAVRAQDFGATPDSARGGAPVAHFPSLDLAVIDFGVGAAQPPRWANVLFSREHPQGVVAALDGRAGAAANLRFDQDLQGPNGDSIAWAPDADWSRLPFVPLAGRGALRFVAPYPASLLKLMVAVGLGLALDRGLIADWPAALLPMIVVSDNDATTECVALLHKVAMVDALNARLAQLGLVTLQMHGTRPDGGWRNADGAGVGRIHMTAWDTARLLWLLTPQAPPPPWLPRGSLLLQPATAGQLLQVLRRQAVNDVLSSGSLREVPGWVPGLPDPPAFAHKTGTTENYASDAGIVQFESHCYIVAWLSSLGSRYAPDPRCATTWRTPALGAAIHRLIEAGA